MFRIITYKLTNIEPSEAINNYVLKRFSVLDRYLAGVGLPHDCAIEIGHTTKHHKKGRFFRAEADFVLPKHIIRAEAEADDLYAAIDILQSELTRQIKSHKEKIRTKVIKGARRVRNK